MKAARTGIIVLALSSVVLGCGSEGQSSGGTGGQTATGGAPGGGVFSGGSTGGGGTTVGGGASAGGTAAGGNTGGGVTVGSGGSLGGASPVGGSTSGGQASGGSPWGGSTSGGQASGGGSAGGNSGSGGQSSGGVAAGGTPASGGSSATGGVPMGDGGSPSGGTSGSGGSVGTSICGVNPSLATGKLQMENLCRGVIAVRSGSDNFVSWRLMGYEPADVGFNVYRDGTQVNSILITDSTNYLDKGAPATATYTVRAVIDGTELGDSSSTRTSAAPATTRAHNYIEIPLETTSGYRAGDTSAGDLDGDGEYELVVKEEQSPQDPSKDGTTGQPKFVAYELDGALLWRVDLGVNVRESEHTTPFVVYDLDGDGSAELVVKTAPGTKDGTGEYLHTGPAASDDDNRDYRNAAGRILSGPEYLTVFSGKDGAELATIDYHAPFDSGYWGDDWGNRSDRYNGSAAFLDETGRPSAVMQRGYYARTTFGAYNYRDGELSLVWAFDSSASGNSAYAGKGCHTMMVADTDGDGRQEIIPGAINIGPDGKGICTVSGGGHGDALHIGDFIPSRPGLEVFQPTESEGAPAYIMRDAKDCAVIWKGPNSTSEGPGRGAADDVSPNHPGGEAWVNNAGLFSATDGSNAGSNPRSCNFLLWWDGDESRELLDGNSVSEYDGEGEGFTASGCSSINGTKSVPNLSADLFGDWREEVVFLCGSNLRVYTTTQVTQRRIHTLMHDPQYRMNVSSENASYNQPPHTSFHIGAGMADPPRPNISVK